MSLLQVASLKLIMHMYYLGRSWSKTRILLLKSNVSVFCFPPIQCVLDAPLRSLTVISSDILQSCPQPGTNWISMVLVVIHVCFSLRFFQGHTVNVIFYKKFTDELPLSIKINASSH